MKTYKQLIDLYPDFLTVSGAIFRDIIYSGSYMEDLPWLSLYKELDIEYIGNISGDKIISPLLKRLYDNDSLTYRSSIAKNVIRLYLDRWKKLYATLILDYNPIENYNMTEVLDLDDSTIYGKTETLTNNLSHGKTGTETTAPNLTRTTDNKIHGFNSSTGVSADEQTESTTGNSILTHNTTDTDTGTETTVNSGSDTYTRDHTLTRSGNIGVTTSQQMIESERELWLWSYFYDVVFPDVDRVLTIPIY